MGKRGTRRLERIEIKGNPYNHLMNYHMNEVKEKIIYFLYDMRVAKTSQLIRYTGYSSHYVRNILRDMYINYIVYRDYPPIKRGRYGSGEGVYFLDNQGGFFIAADKGIEKKDVNWDPRDNVVSIGAVKHSLDITEIRVCMEDHVKDIKVAEFIGERKIGQINFEYQGEEMSFKPDGKITLIKKMGDKTAKLSFLLEYDRGTESLKTFLEKTMIYEKFFMSRKVKDLFGNVHPAILIITNKEDRTARLKELVLKNTTQPIKYYFDTLNNDFINSPFEFLTNNS